MVLRRTRANLHEKNGGSRYRKIFHVIRIYKEKKKSCESLKK